MTYNLPTLMPGYGNAFGRGLILGAGAALLYMAARDSLTPARPRTDLHGLDDDADEPSRLIDWDWSTRIAIRTAGRSMALHPSATAQLQQQYEDLLREIEGPIARYTGNELSLGNTKVEVHDRADWIRANMANFRDLLQPVEDFYRETAARSAFGPPPAFQQAARLMLSSQVGVLVGYLARRVLGQYDIACSGREPTDRRQAVLRRAEHAPGSNTRWPCRRTSSRRWIALHEATHAHEFELHPWVRSYMNDSLEQYLRLLIDDMRGRGDERTMLVIANRFIANLRQGHNVINALMTPEPARADVAAASAHVAGRGLLNHVMNAVGRELLPHFELIHERVEHRQRQRSQIEQAFLKLTGLSMKMEQYRLGERFVDHVVTERGISFANRAWQEPETLPTEAEIRDPGRWIQRMEAVQTA